MKGLSNSLSRSLVLLGVTVAVLTACQNLTVSTAPGSCGLTIDAGASEEEQIWGLIAAESKLLIAQDAAGLMRLWAEDGKITDLKNTPDDPSDDQTWIGTDTIRYRYMRNVFPSAPDVAQPSDLNIQLLGDRAVITATTRIGQEISPAGDRWKAVKVDDCWLLQELDYNRELLPVP